MQVGKNQNLGFGFVHCEVNPSKVSKAAIKEIESFYFNVISNIRGHQQGDYIADRYIGFRLTCPKQEKSLVKVLNLLGATAKRTVTKKSTDEAAAQATKRALDVKG